MEKVIFLVRPIIYLIGLISIYYFKGYSSNEYMGFNQLDFDLFSLFSVFVVVFYFLFFLRKPVYKPSDIFIGFYGLIVFTPYVALHGVWGRDEFSYLIDLVMLLFPVLGVVVIRLIKFKSFRFYCFREIFVLYLIIILSILVVFYLIFNSPTSASFSLLDSYTRRIEARELYGSGTFISYFSSMVMNGVLPALAFLGVVSRRVFIAFFPLVLFLCFYYIYGVKAPLLYIFLSYVFAVFYTCYSVSSFFKFIFTMIIVSFVVAWIEFAFMGYSFLEDYLIRRVYYGGSYLIGAYFELFDSESFSRLTGLGDRASASMYVGEEYLGRDNLNANTNTFLYYLIQYGYLGYFMSVISVGFIFSFFDTLYKKNKLFLYLSFIYTLLILEQSFTTALLSSGIGVLAILYLFVKPEASKGEKQ